MEKTFSKFELAKLKRTAQNLEPYFKKQAKLIEEKQKIEEELEKVNQLIKLNDAPTIELTGYSTKDILRKVVVPQPDKVDKNGNPIKITRYEFIYPETIIPVTYDSISSETTEANEGNNTVLDFSIPKQEIGEDIPHIY